jgi:hypothetical protein
MGAAHHGAAPVPRTARANTAGVAMSAVANGFVELTQTSPPGPCAPMLAASYGANGISGTSDIDALAASLLMGTARQLDFAAACLTPSEELAEIGCPSGVRAARRRTPSGNTG